MKCYYIILTIIHNTSETTNACDLNNGYPSLYNCLLCLLLSRLCLWAYLRNEIHGKMSQKDNIPFLIARCKYYIFVQPAEAYEIGLLQAYLIVLRASLNDRRT